MTGVSMLMGHFGDTHTHTQYLGTGSLVFQIPCRVEFDKRKTEKKVLVTKL